MKTKRFSIKRSSDGAHVIVRDSARVKFANWVIESDDLRAGFGSIFDLGGTHLVAPKLGTLLSDKRMLNQDFLAIGRDMKDLLSEQLDYLEG